MIGGDGRADSPGHSAKFGAYTAMELRVIDIQLVQSNEVGCSYHMELEGLKRTVDMLWKQDLVPAVIVSDRLCLKWSKKKAGSLPQSEVKCPSPKFLNLFLI